MATTSQKIMDIRFFVLIRGALTPPPRMETPVVNIPLQQLPSATEPCLKVDADVYTMLLRLQITRYIAQCPCPPTRKVKHSQGTGRPRRHCQSQSRRIRWVVHTLKASPSPLKSISSSQSVAAYRRDPFQLTKPYNTQGQCRTAHAILENHLG